MMTGAVNADLDPLLVLTVPHARGQPHAVETVIDIGFNGFLALPPSLIVALGLRRVLVAGPGAVYHPVGGPPMNTPMITSDPAMMLGKPVVAGTRITVELILRKLGAGESIDQLLDSHPRLSRDAILAALRFAAESLGAEVVRPVARQSA